MWCEILISFAVATILAICFLWGLYIFVDTIMNLGLYDKIDIFYWFFTSILIMVVTGACVAGILLDAISKI